MGCGVATRFVRHNLPGFTAMISQYTPEEPLCSRAIPLCLKIHIDDVTILFHSSPQVAPLAVDLHEDFVNVEGVTVAPMLSLQAAGIDGTKLDAPETDRFSSDDNTSLGEEILDISVAQVEAIV